METDLTKLLKSRTAIEGACVAICVFLEKQGDDLDEIDRNELDHLADVLDALSMMC